MGWLNGQFAWFSDRVFFRRAWPDPEKVTYNSLISACEAKAGRRAFVFSSLPMWFSFDFFWEDFGNREGALLSSCPTLPVCSIEGSGKTVALQRRSLGSPT